jgi:hypothetical protein
MSLRESYLEKAISLTGEALNQTRETAYMLAESLREYFSGKEYQLREPTGRTFNYKPSLTEIFQTKFMDNKYKQIRKKRPKKIKGKQNPHLIQRRKKKNKRGKK